MKPHKLVAIQKYGAPTNVKQLRSFLCLASYYRRFVEKFSYIAHPLTQLTKRDAPFVWTEEADQAFQLLKTKVASAPVLQLHDPDLPNVIATDASDDAIGAVLQQDSGRGLQPVAFESRKLQGAELNYPIYEKEGLAVVHALKTWRHYLEGQHTIITTDHFSLKFITTQSSVQGRMTKWADFISSFGNTLEIKYLKGEDNVVTDALSRDPQYLPVINAVLHAPHNDIPQMVTEQFHQDDQYQDLLRQPGEDYNIKDGLLYKQDRLYIQTLTLSSNACWNSTMMQHQQLIWGWERPLSSSLDITGGLS
jgi:hypothetical protein